MTHMCYGMLRMLFWSDPRATPEMTRRIKRETHGMIIYLASCTFQEFLGFNEATSGSESPSLLVTTDGE